MAHFNFKGIREYTVVSRLVNYTAMVLGIKLFFVPSGNEEIQQKSAHTRTYIRPIAYFKCNVVPNDQGVEKGPCNMYVRYIKEDDTNLNSEYILADWNLAHKHNLIFENARTRSPG